GGKKAQSPRPSMKKPTIIEENPNLQETRDAPATAVAAETKIILRPLSQRSHTTASKRPTPREELSATSDRFARAAPICNKSAVSLLDHTNIQFSLPDSKNSRAPKSQTSGRFNTRRRP